MKLVVTLRVVSGLFVLMDRHLGQYKIYFMVKNVLIKAAEGCHLLGGGYQTPKVKVVLFQPEGVLCASIFNEEHQGFELDLEETL